MDAGLLQFEVKYKENQIIFCEYEKGDSFYFIKSGKVKLIRQVDGAESILDVLSPGVFFGEMAIIEAAPRTATAIATDDVVLLKFSSENFEVVVLKNNSLVVRLIKTFVNRIWAQQQRLQIYRFKDSSPRIIALLLNLKVEVGDNEKQSTQVNVSIEDLAKWVGSSVNGCKKVLQNLASLKLISVQEKTIILNDLPSLERQLSMHSHMLSNTEEI